MEDSIIGYRVVNRLLFPMWKSEQIRSYTRAGIMCDHCGALVTTYGGPAHDVICVECAEKTLHPE